MITFGRLTKLSSLFVAIFWGVTGRIWKRLPRQSSSPVVAISSSRLIKLVVSLSTGMVFIYSITNYQLRIFLKLWQGYLKVIGHEYFTFALPNNDRLGAMDTSRATG
jgi:hypothetical protein